MEGAFQKSFFLGVGIIAVSIAVLGGGLYWLSHDLRGQATAIIADRMLIDEHSRSLENLADLKQLLPEAEGYEDRLHALLPTKDELLDFPRWLDSIARVDRVEPTFTFQGSAINPTGANPGYIAFTLDVSGPYDGLHEFFTSVEQKSSRFLAALDSFDVAARGGGNEYRIVAQGRLFFR